jgi:hypothetical protein
MIMGFNHRAQHLIGTQTNDGEDGYGNQHFHQGKTLFGMGPALSLLSAS